jgi:hypothetical protein
MASSNPTKFLRYTLIALVSCAVLVVVILGYVVIRYNNMERHFREIQPDDTEVKLLAVVGSPTAIRECDERLKSGQRKCVREYWYNTYILGDGWIIPIDEAGTIMQIRRTALP